jgi:hypothetical protein
MLHANARELSNAGVKKIEFYPGQDVFNKQPNKQQSHIKNLLEFNKKLSQLIARSWLPGGEEIEKRFLGSQEEVIQLLVDEGIVTAEEAPYIGVNVDTNPPGPPYVGNIQEGVDPVLTLYIPYPKRPSQVTSAELTTWVDSQINAAPYSPFEISQWIPYTC